MNRLRDYVGFAVWFTGLGYMAIWPLSADGTGGALFGASLVCHLPAVPLLATLCRVPHPFSLPPGLHLLGFVSAVTVMLRLVCRALRSMRHVCTGGARTTRAPRVPTRTRPLLPAKPPRPLPRVKPRSEFGLRGTPR